MPTYNSPDDADNELHKLLLTAVPENKHGNKTLNHLAATLGVTKWAIRKSPRGSANMRWPTACKQAFRN